MRLVIGYGLALILAREQVGYSSENLAAGPGGSARTSHGRCRHPSILPETSHPCDAGSWVLTRFEVALLPRTRAATRMSAILSSTLSGSPWARRDFRARACAVWVMRLTALSWKWAGCVNVTDEHLHR